jgi:predicted Zn-dependent protease
MRKTILAVAAALSLSCATSGPNKGEFNLIAVDQEMAMGEQINQQVHGEMQVVKDPAATAYLQRLGQKILSGVPETPFEFQFHIVNDPAVNAFAVPGGHLYVNTGLIQAADAESELAGVLGHEIAHAVERHGTEQLTKAYGFNIVAGLALGQDAGILEQLAAQVGGAAILMKYGRDAEREADKLAVKYLYNAGIDPRGVLLFFQELEQQEGGKTPPKFLAWLSTHPLTSDRIKDTERRIAKLDLGAKRLVKDTADFHEFKQRFTERVSLR